MIDLSQETYSRIRPLMLDRVPDIYDKREGGIIQTALGPAGWALEGFYLAGPGERFAFVQTAVGQSLDYLAAIAGLCATRLPRQCGWHL